GTHRDLARPVRALPAVPRHQRRGFPLHLGASGVWGRRPDRRRRFPRAGRTGLCQPRSCTEGRRLGPRACRQGDHLRHGHGQLPGGRGPAPQVLPRALPRRQHRGGEGALHSRSRDRDRGGRRSRVGSI
ncbi:MAG: RidA/YER057c/UK114 superfamily protein, partial [uncultured Sphingomonas sp.]